MPLTLNGESLPWVKRAVHLGHHLSQEASMELDAQIKRVEFIENSTNIRDCFNFAHPMQVLQAVTTYSTHFYGAMLWNHYGGEANKVYRTWNTVVKLVWGLPRATHTFFVKHLSCGLLSTRERLLCQYKKCACLNTHHHEHQSVRSQKGILNPFFRFIGRFSGE